MFLQVLLLPATLLVPGSTKQSQEEKKVFFWDGVMIDG